MSGCVFSVFLQKVKIRIQNELTVHPSASLSVNEDVRNNFSQSYQCFNALKCQKCAIKKFFSMLAPGPLDRFQVSSQVFKSKGRKQKVRQISFQAFKSTISMLTPGPLVQQISLFDRTFSSLFNSKSRRRNH